MHLNIMKYGQKLYVKNTKLTEYIVDKMATIKHFIQIFNH